MVKKELIERKHLDSIIAKLRVDHEFYCGVSSRYMEESPMMSRLFYDLSQDMKKLHYDFALRRKVLDVFLAEDQVCVCEECGISNASVDDRKEHFKDILLQKKHMSEMCILNE